MSSSNFDASGPQRRQVSGGPEPEAHEWILGILAVPGAPRQPPEPDHDRVDQTPLRPARTPVRAGTGTLSLVTDTAALVERVVDGLGRLATVGEAVEDEWTYVHDLETVWAARLRAVAASPVAGSLGAATAPPELETALDRLIAEADLISDPHRAIDWLSTLPQATLVALGESAW